MIEGVRSLGFDTVELNFSLTKEWVDEVRGFVRDGVIKVSSLHNMCPLPKDMDPKISSSPDYFSLASLNEVERLRAVEAALNTIRYATHLGAKAVVIHAGRVEMKDRTRELASLIEADPRSSKIPFLRDEMIKSRAVISHAHVESLLKSLEPLVKAAESENVVLGIENRYYYREIPLIEEAELIFKAFPSEAIGYWHDVGHAEVFVRSGLLNKHEDLIGRFQNRLKGMHLHDIIGVNNDHRLPGLGSFDFKILKPYISDDILTVLEIHDPVDTGSIPKGIKHLNLTLGI